MIFYVLKRYKYKIENLVSRVKYVILNALQVPCTFPTHGGQPLNVVATLKSAPLWAMYLMKATARDGAGQGLD